MRGRYRKQRNNLLFTVLRRVHYDEFAELGKKAILYQTSTV